MNGMPQNRAQRLAADAADAAEVRGYQTDPDVIALRVEHVRTQVDRMCWAGMVLGLAFTMTNVQQFAAADAGAGSLPWLAAWVLDPTVSLVLVAILRAEQITARYRVPTGRWVRRAKWFTLAATYLMNTWASYAVGDAASIVLHSVPPLVVFVAAEATTEVRDQLTEAVTRAHREAASRMHAVNGMNGAVHGESDGVQSDEDNRKVGRTSFADYLAEARSAWTPAVEITPAWVRRVTGCSRGLSPRLARALAASVSGGDHR